MADIRLNKLTKQFNIGLQTLVDFLNQQGAGLEMNPNAKVSDEYLPALEKKFGEDLKAVQEAAKVEIKMNQIIERNTRRQADEEEEELTRETIIVNTGLSSADKAEKPAAPEEEPVKQDVEAAAEPEHDEPVNMPEPEPEPAAEPQNAAEPQIEAEPQLEAEPEPEPEIVPEPVSEPETEPEPETEAVPSAEEEAAAAPGPEVQAESETAAGESEPQPVAEETSAPAAEPAEPGKPAHEEPKPAATPAAGGLKIVGKVDLSKLEPKRGKKRERIAKAKVDINKVEGVDARKKKDTAPAAGGKNDRKDRKARGRDKGKVVMTEAEREEMQKEIQKQVKETYARMNDSKKGGNFGAKYRKEKRELASQKMQEEMEAVAAEKSVLKVTEFVTVNDLATLMDNTPVNKVIAACFNLGLMVSINQRLDAEALVLVAEEFGYKVEFVTAELTEEIDQEVDREEDLVPRPPVITVMGHVDHGKTSLLDYIRKTNVIAGEAGGITQHIGAYNVELPDGRRITFLDTPGHEAFTAMRARGAQMTDLAIIIIAADDAVMPQTVEAINHAQAAGVPMVFAINKIDKPGAQPEKIYQQLSQMNILTEAWGGKYQCQEISAKQGIGVDKLLEKVLLETDMMELKANPKRLGTGAVIESSLDKGRGYLATILVQNGTVHKGDMMLSGQFYGRIKAMLNERGQYVTVAGPSTPVSVLGLSGAPSAGEKFNIMTDEKEAKAIAGKREQLLRIQGIKPQKHMTLEEIGRRIAIGNFKELNIIVKGDVDGSVEALSDSLIKLSTEEVHVNVIHKAVGAISESDVMLATASDAIIIGFQVRPSSDARNLAEKEGIEIRLYSIIYDAINEVKDGIEGMLEPEKKEEVTSTATVKQTFKISKVGTIAGCLIKDGKMAKPSKVRLIRDGIVIYTGELSSLKRGKDDVKEVQAGMECGIGIEGYNDIKDGDVIEAFQIVEIKRTL